MTENTTRVIKLANGESIVCTCIPTRTDEGSNKLHVVHPLKMELKNRITKKGVVEALSLSRWLQPFTESDEFDWSALTYLFKSLSHLGVSPLADRYLPKDVSPTFCPIL